MAFHKPENPGSFTVPLEHCIFYDSTTVPLPLLPLEDDCPLKVQPILAVRLAQLIENWFSAAVTEVRSPVLVCEMTKIAKSVLFSRVSDSYLSFHHQSRSHLSIPRWCIHTVLQCKLDVLCWSSCQEILYRFLLEATKYVLHKLYSCRNLAWLYRLSYVLLFPCLIAMHASSGLMFDLTVPCLTRFILDYSFSLECSMFWISLYVLTWLNFALIFEWNSCFRLTRDVLFTQRNFSSD